MSVEMDTLVVQTNDGSTEYEIVDRAARDSIAAIDASGSSITVDSELSATSTNPVQNSVVTNALAKKMETDTNTTYSLSKNGTSIILTGSDGTTSSVTDSNTTYSSLKNPYSLTFTGGASATYDGSSAVSVAIPSGSGVYEMLMSDQLTANAASWSFDLSDYAGSYNELIIYCSFWHNASGLYPLYVQLNGYSSSNYYVYYDMTNGSATLSDSILVGYLTGSSHNTGLCIHLELYDKQVVVRSTGIAMNGTSTSNVTAFDCVGTTTPTITVTKSNISSCKFMFSSSSSVKMVSGSAIYLYGLKAST